MNRTQLGQQKIGIPVHAVFEAMTELIDERPWPDFRRDPVGYYFDKMIGGWLIRLIDNAVTDEQLRAVTPDAIHLIVLLLMRDMFRHNREILRPDRDEEWVEPLFNELAATLGIPLENITDEAQPYELEDISQCAWAEALAAPLGLPGIKLFACQSAIVSSAAEEFSVSE